MIFVSLETELHDYTFDNETQKIAEISCRRFARLDD